MVPTAQGLGDKMALSIPEAARLLGVHEDTVARCVRSGSIPATRIGRRVLISRNVLQELLDRGGDLDGSTRAYKPVEFPGAVRLHTAQRNR